MIIWIVLPVYFMINYVLIVLNNNIISKSNSKKLCLENYKNINYYSNLFIKKCMINNNIMKII